MKKILLILLFTLIATTCYATNWCNDDNNVGCFLMEDSTTETDRSGNTSNDMTVSDGDTIAQSTDKVFGTYSRDFEKYSTEYLYHADGLDTDINGADVNITVTAWIKLKSNAAQFHSIVAKYSTSSQRQYIILLDNEKVTVFLSPDGTASTLCKGATTLSLDTWYHVAFVYNDTDIRIYVNGYLDSASGTNPIAHTTGLYNSTSEFVIGNRTSTNINFDGLIDDVAVFDRALSATEILDIYTNGLYEAGGTHPVPTTSELRNITLRNVTVQ